MGKKNEPNELYISRVYDAPVKMVWDTWTDPKKVAKWWGPRGFTLTTHSKDFRVGGTWNYTMWDRLAEYLEKEATDKDIFVINRTFDAPLDLMFQVWTDSKHISKWLAPTGFEMKFLNSEIKPGATTFYFMKNESGLEMYGQATYLEIDGPNRIVYTQQFRDKDQNLSRHPLAPTWPESMRTVVTFTAESATQTRVTILWQADGQTTKAELETFVNGRSGMTMGWTGSFDKLETYLASLV